MNCEPKEICIMGLGYIGLPTASIMATHGFNVYGVDVNQKAVDTINKGEVHIYEPDLDVMVKAAVKSGSLRASTTPSEADAFVLAVPTPFKGDHEPDLTYVEAATRAIAPLVRNGNLVILESTSPVETTEKVCQWLREENPSLTVPQRNEDFAEGTEQVYVAHCPERVLPGHIMRELLENDRVIGGINTASAEKTRELYSTFVSGELLITDSRTAEMCKLTENASRDVSIAFANELSLICDELDIDVWKLISLANRHPRVNILNPGPGVGGHCIAVDPWFIVNRTPEQAKLIHSSRLVNESKPQWVLDRVLKEIGDRPSLKVACFGLAFKPDIDDLRESPALHITQQLAQTGKVEVLAVEPHIDELPKKLAGLNVNLCTEQEAIAAADIVLILVAHSAFKKSLTHSSLAAKTVFDTCGLLR